MIGNCFSHAVTKRKSFAPRPGALNHLRETGGHWKERAIPPMAVLGEQYPRR
jgi:hypothetical protein